MARVEGAVRRPQEGCFSLVNPKKMSSDHVKNNVAGSLHSYGSHNLCYFEFAGTRPLAECTTRLAILIPGMMDGLLTVPFFTPLAADLTRAGFKTVQPILRSSYHQFGFRSLDTDVEDVIELLKQLLLDQAQFSEIVFLGHSTGCQDLVHLLRSPVVSHNVNLHNVEQIHVFL